MRSKCLSSWRILLNSFSSACAQIQASEGADTSRYPNETDRRRKASKRPRSAAFVYPNHAEAAYDILDSTVAPTLVIDKRYLAPGNRYMVGMLLRKGIDPRSDMHNGVREFPAFAANVFTSVVDIGMPSQPVAAK